MTREPFTALDWIAVVLAAGATLVLVAMIPVAESFRAMFADFGRDAPLPWLTRIVTMPFAPLLLAVPSTLSLALGLRARGLGARRAAVVFSFTLALVAFAACWVGFYLPIWELADALQE